MNAEAVKNPAFDAAVEKAVVFLVQAFVASGHNPKPVILHSIRTAFRLYRQNCAQDVVVAAVLHDLLEDTDMRLAEVEENFGPAVARLVAANSFDPQMADRRERDLDVLRRCKRAGKGALLVKAADILDNSDYYCRVSADDELFRWLLQKLKYFLEMSSSELAGEPVWANLRGRLEELSRISGITP
jgi:(p)ppGpp synthase/HD superfamily hydrolase